MTETPYQVGDVVTLSGPTVPADLVGKWFYVVSVNERGCTLSSPYHDRELTRPYHPSMPDGPPAPARTRGDYRRVVRFVKKQLKRAAKRGA